MTADAGGGHRPADDANRGQPTDPVQWMRQRWAEFDQPAPEHFAAMASLFRVYQIVSSTVDTVLRGHELGRSAYLTLLTLQMSRTHTRRMTDLSRQLMVHPATITQVCEQLEQRGLLIRRQHPEDRRTVLATLTTEGLEAVAKANADVAQVECGFRDVTPEFAVVITEILRQVRERVGDTEP